jgi:hypothetical protein
MTEEFALQQGLRGKPHNSPIRRPRWRREAPIMPVLLSQAGQDKHSERQAEIPGMWP